MDFAPVLTVAIAVVIGRRLRSALVKGNQIGTVSLTCRPHNFTAVVLPLQ